MSAIFSEALYIWECIYSAFNKKWQLGWILNSWFNLFIFIPLNSAAISPLPSGIESCCEKYHGLRLACLVDNLLFLPVISQVSIFKVKSIHQDISLVWFFLQHGMLLKSTVLDALFQKYFLLLYIWVIFLLNIFWFIFKDPTMQLYVL